MSTSLIRRHFISRPARQDVRRARRCPHIEMANELRPVAEARYLVVPLASFLILAIYAIGLALAIPDTSRMND